MFVKGSWRWSTGTSYYNFSCERVQEGFLTIVVFSNDCNILSVDVNWSEIG